MEIVIQIQIVDIWIIRKCCFPHFIKVLIWQKIPLK